jgi:hypothetical protein
MEWIGLQRWTALTRIIITVVTICLVCFVVFNGTTMLPVACSSSNNNTVTPPPSSTGRTYTTQFPATESPISESGNWINGLQTGLDWANIATVPGLAYGLDSGNKGFDDSTALLTGSWGADQMAQATVHTVNQSDSYFEEVELRLRSSLSPHRATGYEINFRCSKTANAYTQVVRWNGPLGDFSYLDSRGGSQYGVTEGDIVKATIVGNAITVYINGVQVLQVTDNTYTSGSPGMGFYLANTTGTNRDYGFTKFTASDSPQLLAAAAGKQLD